MNKIVVASALAAASLPSTADAAIVINVTQVGSDVVATGAGTFDTAGLVKGSLATGDSAINASASVLRISSGNASWKYNFYAGVTGPATFGSGRIVTSTTATGDSFGIYGASGQLYLPTKYVSGETLSGSTTFANQTFASLGLTLGSYVYQSANDTLTVNIGVGAVPEPATWAMMLIGFGMVGAACRYRRRSVKVSLI